MTTSDLESHVPHSDVIRVGVIGVGVMGADHARKLSRVVSGATVTAVADFDPRVAATVADEVGATALEDGVAVIDHPAVDAVVVATRDDTHADLVRAAIRARKPVLCEKPLAPTAAECRELVGECASAGASDLVTLGFMRRFDPSYVALRDRIREGDCGAPLLAHCVSRTVQSYPGGDSAATITNSAVHELDVMPWLLDSPIVEVSWQHGRSAAHVADRQDPQLYLLRTQSGVLITSELFLNARYGYDIRCEVVMETGVCALTQPTHIVSDSQRTRSIDYAADWIPRFSDAYRLELQEWIDSLRLGRPSTLAGVTDGLRAAVVADALIASMNSGGAWVAVPD
ncbi:Gfo/Idh/MocA family oxidoreductase [Mycobacterium kyogaense]|uniref:Gfo/Idh/MocA family oxidoreductase n=1 Tax=Mycobacterium kyogaense TaxID=2212479 RepID=UPI0023E25AC9|nr:Gfo/Idh/MocA family oxidoreductase [Mycobacterium kyogaense]